MRPWFSSFQKPARGAFEVWRRWAGRFWVGWVLAGRDAGAGTSPLGQRLVGRSLTKPLPGLGTPLLPPSLASWVTGYPGESLTHPPYRGYQAGTLRLGREVMGWHLGDRTGRGRMGTAGEGEGRRRN